MVLEFVDVFAYNQWALLWNMLQHDHGVYRT